MKRSARPILSRRPPKCAKYARYRSGQALRIDLDPHHREPDGIAELERTTVDIAAKAGSRVLELRATGQVVKFDGFLALYQEGRDDDGDDEDSRRLPAMSEGEALKRKGSAVTQHFTEPPPRFSEASLVKRMEELGIGRPSTYASILQVLKDRGYVSSTRSACIREDKGRVVVAFLEKLLRQICRI
jgi:DNA topoisomerase-1